MTFIETPEFAVEAPVKTIQEQAAEILDKCVEDIKNGYWICGKLLNMCKRERPQGCAIGLVGWNSGAARWFVSDKSWLMGYATDNSTEWTEEGKLALKFLSQAIPGGDFREDVINVWEDRIMLYNDETRDDGSPYLSPPEAIEWFERAAALARES